MMGPSSQRCVKRSVSGQPIQGGGRGRIVSRVLHPLVKGLPTLTLWGCEYRPITGISHLIGNTEAQR